MTTAIQKPHREMCEI